MLPVIELLLSMTYKLLVDSCCTRNDRVCIEIIGKSLVK